MSRFGVLFVSAALAVAAVPAQEEKKFEITPAMQTEIDRLRKDVAGWAAEPRVVGAVVEQNKKGPIEGMDNKKWKTLRRRSPEVDVFTTNVAAKVLAEKAGATDGVVSEAFLNACR